MAVATDHRTVDGVARPIFDRQGTVLAAATVAAGAAVVVLVSVDGTPVWQLVRGMVAAAACWAGVVDVHRHRGVHRAEIAFVVGSLAAAAGAGIAGPHLAKVGLTLLGAAGLLLLLAGLVLAGTGAVTIVRAARPWGRLAVVPGLAVVLAVALFVVGQAVAVNNVPRTGLGSRTPADLGLPYEDVRFGTPDRELLAGWYVPSTNGAAVAVLHGAGSNRAGVLDVAAVLARHGYGVLLYDARGHGESSGHAMDFGWHGDQDVAAAVSFLERQPGVDPERIGLVGMSMGGEQAIGAAANDARIAAVVAEGAGHRVAGDKAWLSDVHGARGWLQEQLDRLMYAVTDVLTEASPPITLRAAVAAAAPRPFLLIAGGDARDERHETAYIAGGAPGTVETWIVPGAGHTAALATDPDGWESRVITFLDAALVANE